MSLTLALPIGHAGSIRHDERCKRVYAADLRLLWLVIICVLSAGTHLGVHFAQTGISNVEGSEPSLEPINHWHACMHMPLTKLTVLASYVPQYTWACWYTAGSLLLSSSWLSSKQSPMPVAQHLPSLLPEHPHGHRQPTGINATCKCSWPYNNMPQPVS